MLKDLQRRLDLLQRKFRSKEQVVQAWFDAVERGDVAAAADLLDDGFVCRGWTPCPLRRQEFVDMHRRLLRAFPDWSFHARDFRVSGDAVAVTTGATGTQTGDLHLPEVAAANVPPTGQPVSLPEEYPVFIVRHGLITEMHEVIPPGAGLMGILRQLGQARGCQGPLIANQGSQDAIETTSWESFVLSAAGAR